MSTLSSKSMSSSTSSSPATKSVPPPMSLTPRERSDEATHEAMVEGGMNALLTVLPLMGVVMIAMKNSPSFVKRTNWQSRTALVVMPTLFVATLTSEQKFVHKMKEIAAETEHSVKTVEWAEQQMIEKYKENIINDIRSTEDHLKELYQQSVLQSRTENVCIVPGNQLKWYHRSANFVANNPIKVLASLAIPSVAWIFYGNTNKQHLDFSVKLMHTRVFGQFTTLSILLGVIGFKEFMDQNGRFISEGEATERVNEMELVRQQLLYRLQLEKVHTEEIKHEIQLAHEEDIRDHHIKMKKDEKKKHEHEHETTK